AALPLLAVLHGFARERSRRFDAQLDADRFEQLARRDALTGLANRLNFDERLGVELARAARYDRPLSLCLLDLDWFKDYNDRHGPVRIEEGRPGAAHGRFLTSSRTSRSASRTSTKPRGGSNCARSLIGTATSTSPPRRNAQTSGPASTGS